MGRAPSSITNEDRKFVDTASKLARTVNERPSRIGQGGWIWLAAMVTVLVAVVVVFFIVLDDARGDDDGSRPPWYSKDGTVNWDEAPDMIGVSDEHGAVICPDGTPLMVPYGPDAPTLDELAGVEASGTLTTTPEGGQSYVSDPPTFDWPTVCAAVRRGVESGSW